MSTCKPPPHELDAFEACAALSDRRRLAPSGGGKPGESGGGKPVPIVGVSVVGRHASAGFDHAAAETFLANLDARLDGRATALLAQNGVTDLVDASYKLSCNPNRLSRKAGMAYAGPSESRRLKPNPSLSNFWASAPTKMAREVVSVSIARNVAFAPTL